MRWLILSLAGGAVAAACAQGAEETGVDVGGASGTAGSGMGQGASTSTRSGGGSQGGAGPMAQACPPGEFATGLEGGLLQCASIDDTMRANIHASCSIYAAWQDQCTGCITPPPSKWGRASGGDCSTGVGANNTCTTPSLAGATVSLFGLNTDGDVNDDDKFHFGLTCDRGADSPEPGPCSPGELVAGIDGNVAQCVSPQAAVADYVNASCALYVGWLDGCDACGLAPSRWGNIRGDSCANGAGTTNSCTTPSFGGSAINVFGLNTDGNVNDDDKFYFGLHCDPAAPEGGPADGTCPGGQLVIGVNGDGTVECSAIAPAAQAAFESACYLYAGWLDNCDGCSDAPARWGRVRVGACENGVGANNTCTTETLGTPTVNLFGLNTDGDVNDDDKFYFGLSCL